MSHNALFCHEQFGFRTGHSTELASLQLTDYLIKRMDQGGTPPNIYILISHVVDVRKGIRLKNAAPILFINTPGKGVLRRGSPTLL